MLSQLHPPVVAPEAQGGSARARGCPAVAPRLRRRCRDRHPVQVHVTLDKPAEQSQSAEVERVTGVRLVPKEGTQVMSVEYRIQWKDDTVQTWEPARNVADDVLRDFEARWWGAARKGDTDTLADMLAGGKEVLATTVDDNKRTALHFACGVGSEPCVRLLLENGADVGAEDKVGYTPLHIAAGYLNKSVARILLEAGADPELQDQQKRSALDLVLALKSGTPTSPEYFARRAALDDMAAELESFMFEELQPVAILAKRGGGEPLAEGEAAQGVEYLVHWGDGAADTWEPERNVADDVIADFEAGLEYASAVAIASQRRLGGTTEYLVTWADGAEPSWQEEEQIDEGVMRAWLDVRGEAGGKQQGGKRRKEPKPRNAPKQPQAQAQADTQLVGFDPLQQADQTVHT